jgi:hypothetical protein
MRLWSTLRGAWQRAIKPARIGAPLIATRPDIAGVRGHIFNPLPDPDGKWSVLLADEYDTERWPGYRSGFVDLYRWEFVLADHGLQSWGERRHDEMLAQVERDFPERRAS